MTFCHDNGTYKVASISGPGHNYLGLSFADTPVAEVELVSIKLDDKTLERLKGEEVLRQVLAGAEHSSRLLSRPYIIRKAEFVSVPARKNLFPIAPGHY